MLERIRRLFRREPDGTPSEHLTNRFTQVYKERMWTDDQSASGPGSRLDSPWVRLAIEALERTRLAYGFKSMIDIPCGDFNWMPVFLGSHKIRYHGFDIVPDLIEHNARKYPSYRFNVLDVTSQVPPRADLVFSKDMLNHLTNADVNKALKNIVASRSTYMLFSNSLGYTNLDLPGDEAGNSRHLNLLAPPFSLGAPVWNDDHFALWAIRDVEKQIARL